MTRKSLFNTLSLVCATSLYLIPHAALAQESSKPQVYKWVDEKTGAVQYTQQKPPADKAKTSTTIPVISSPASSTPASIPTSATSGSPTPAISDKEKTEHIELLKKNCDAANNNLKTLEANKLVVVEDDKGKARALSPEEHHAQIEKAKKDIDIYCKAVSPNDSKEDKADATTKTKKE